MQKDSVLHDYKKMKNAISHYIKKQEWEIALKTIFFASGFMYTTNQLYYDDELENELNFIAKNILNEPWLKCRSNKKVIFYDSYGNVGRGLGYIYLKALCKLKYEIEYVTSAKDAATQQVVKKLLDKRGRTYVLSGVENSKKMKELQQILEQSEAGMAFLHMTPDDVVGIGTFSLYENRIKRYLINMTDHAFWLGKNACDYVINFRQFGYLVCNFKRKISEDSLLYLPYYPQIEQMPEGNILNTEKQIIFSGGGIYKTYSKDKRYFRLVENILNKYQNIIFIYYGNGYSRDMKCLKRKFQGRVYWEKERTDFYTLMRQCVFYLSTYPYNGGLMTQYALSAGKIPITLCNSGIDSELTINEEEVFWNFYTIDEVMEYIDRVMQDNAFRISQEERLSDFLIDSEKFCEELSIILQSNCSKRQITKTQIQTEGTEKYPLELYSGMNYYRLFMRKGCKHIIRTFPIKYVLGALTYIANKILGRN